MNSQKPEYFSFIQLLNTLSIPVVAGVSCCYAFVSLWYASEFDWMTTLLIGAAVWCIYTVDHIIDGYRLRSKPSAARHHLNYKYRKILVPIVLVISFLTIILAWNRLDNEVFMFALILAALTVFHFIINFFRSNQVRIFLKEPMIAFVVALSITGIPWKQFDLAWNELMLPFGLFFLINLGNLLLFSFCDHEQDLESGNLSLSIKIGKSRSLILAVLSLIVAVSTVILGLVLTPWTYELIMFIPMILLLSGIAAFPEYFSRKGRYRFWGDMVYLMPLFYLLMH